MSRKSDIDELLAEVADIKSDIEATYERAKADPASAKLSKIKVKSALEHLRSVLDYAALDVHETFYDGKGKIYFPYGKNEALFEKHLKSKFKDLAGKSRRVFEIFSSVQTFNCGSDWLITLCNTVNSNKHNRLSSQDMQKEESVSLGNLVKVSGGGSVIIHGGTVNGVPISKDPNKPIVISNESSEEQMKRNLNPNNPFLSLNRETDKLEFIIDDTGWDALELVSEASNGVQSLVDDLYYELTANQ